MANPSSKALRLKYESEASYLTLEFLLECSKTCFFSRLAVDVREQGPLLVDHQYLVSSLRFRCFVRRVDHLCALQFKTRHPSRLCRWRTAQRSLFSLPSSFSFFLPRACRTPMASLGPRTTFKSRMVPSGQFFSSFVAGSFARPSSPTCSFPSTSRVSPF